MAYNNYFPMNYQQYYPQMQGVQNIPKQNQPQQNNGIIWVQGEAGAKSYLVAPNSTVTLWDTESEVILSGVPVACASAVAGFVATPAMIGGVNEG